MSVSLTAASILITRLFDAHEEAEHAARGFYASCEMGPVPESYVEDVAHMLDQLNDRVVQAAEELLTARTAEVSIGNALLHTVAGVYELEGDGYENE
jgi:hypothetical protein